MAIVTVGNQTVTVGDPSLVPYPPVSLNSGVGYIFILSATPPTLTLEFAYLLAIPFIVLGGLAYEINATAKWYLKGTRFSFVVPVYDAGGISLPVSIALKPVEIFKGRGSPDTVTVSLQYDDTLTQPLGFGV